MNNKMEDACLFDMLFFESDQMISFVGFVYLGSLVGMFSSSPHLLSSYLTNSVNKHKNIA
jgi:hypothetical protein